MRVKDFDGTQIRVIGEIYFTLKIGTLDFKVPDISSSYNLLLETPWIHSVFAVTSTLLQDLKIIWYYHDILIHVEKNNSIYYKNTIPIIECVEDLDGSVFIRPLEILSVLILTFLCFKCCHFTKDILRNVKRDIAVSIKSFKRGQGLFWNSEVVSLNIFGVPYRLFSMISISNGCFMPS